MPVYHRFDLMRYLVLVGNIVLVAGRCQLGAAVFTNALSPQEELKTFQLADKQLMVELVAAEPEVLSPVAIAFDPDGRMFVAEMIDYPTGPGLGRLRLLEDRDGDGRYESATVFAEQLPFPNSVLPWQGGVIVTAAPDIWFLKDSDGDGVADVKRVLFTGFGKGNQQLRVNGLTWGIDNWVYGANGRSDGDVKGGAIAAPVSLRGHDFRFRPDTGEFEAIAGRSQFGLGYDDWGNRFLSWNTIPMRHEVLAERYPNRNPNLASTESLQDVLEPGDSGEVFPLAPPPLTFNNESIRNFNALAGLKIFRGTALGEKYRGNAFMGEALLSLVHRRVLEPNGVTFVARRGEQQMEFLSSADPWFHGVNYATGPDGALYVVDFYRRFVEHPDFVQGKARNETPWRTGAEHGRIWRIRDRNLPWNKIKPRLSQESTSQLVAHLRDANGWWRDTAQRQLIERQNMSVLPALKKMAASEKSALGRLHAMYTLEALGALTSESLAKMMRDRDARLREQAVSLCERRLTNATELRVFRSKLESLVSDSDARVRFQVGLAAAHFDESTKIRILGELVKSGVSDRWQRLGILSSVGSNGWSLLQGLVQSNYGWLERTDANTADFLEQLARLIVRSDRAAEMDPLWQFIAKLEPRLTERGGLALLSGVAEGTASSRFPLREVLMNGPRDSLPGEMIRPSVQHAENVAFARDASLDQRLRAVRLISRVGLTTRRLPELLEANEPAPLQAAAARALGDLKDDGIAGKVFDHWTTYIASTRRTILDVAPKSSALAAGLLRQLESGAISIGEINPVVRQGLMRRGDLKIRFERVLKQDGASDRAEVISRFQAALNLEGDSRRGGELFVRNCVVCHSTKGVGGHVGPDLSGIGSKPNFALLIDILDPSRQVSPDYLNYAVETNDGKQVNGFIAGETATSLTLRRPNEPDETLLRTQIKSLRAEVKSLMPEGLEQGMTPQDMADLLAFLRYPDNKYLGAVKTK